MEKYQEVERSLVKKYRKSIWNRFVGGIKDYRMLQEGDRVAVCISGGKDSMLLAKCMQQLQQYSDFPFGLEFIVMDPGYNPENRAMIEKNCALLNIPAHIFETDIFNYVSKIEESPCYLCARMRRGHLYAKAKELGCNKIALGHHFDDVIETILMAMLYGAEVKTMMPKLHSTNFEGMELIRPLYLVKEADILSWKRYNGLEFIQCACRFTENLAKEEFEGKSKRAEMKALIQSLRKTNSQIDQNIFRSVHRVNLETIIGYHAEGVEHCFLDEY